MNSRSNKCDGSGQIVRDVQPFSIVVCPHCKRSLKSRWADGGHSAHVGLYAAHYAYLPRHNKAEQQ